MAQTAAKRKVGVTSATPSVADVLAWLKKNASAKVRNDMEPRYGIVTDKAFGVPVGAMQKYAKNIGKNHDLALALWDTGWYEARMLAAFLDEPELVTPAQMDRWCRDFDNWGICDTVCFHLFDRTPYAFRKIKEWSGKKNEFEKRAAFALLACVALHNKEADDKQFLPYLPLIEKAATDNRNFVKKGVSWALRLIGRRSLQLNHAALEVAKRLAASDEPSAKSIGKEAVKELTSPIVSGQLKAKAKRL
ncbi:MAG TPA: DNA alkylation repair protein [Terriglobales bacterium]|nr:DNA alkylation repair protein [Terriglobales bacterium]